MVFKIYTTEEFDKKFNKLDPQLKDQIREEINQLETNPYVGKPLGYKFFREKKVKNYRIYYTAEGGNTAWSERPAVTAYLAKSPSGDFSPI